MVENTKHRSNETHIQHIMATTTTKLQSQNFGIGYGSSTNQSGLTTCIHIMASATRKFTLKAHFGFCQAKRKRVKEENPFTIIETMFSSLYSLVEKSNTRKQNCLKKIEKHMAEQVSCVTKLEIKSQRNINQYTDPAKFRLFNLMQ